MTDFAAADQGRLQSNGEGAASPPAASISQIAADTAQSIKDEFADVVEDVRHKASDQFEQQRETATKAMSDFAAAVRKAAAELAQQDQSLAAKMIKQAADGLESVSRSVSGKQPEELLDVARDFGRNSPVAFGGAALLAGLAVGRFLRSSEGRRTEAASSRPPGTAAGSSVGPPNADARAEVVPASASVSRNNMTSGGTTAADDDGVGLSSTAAWRG